MDFFLIINFSCKPVIHVLAHVFLMISRLFVGYNSTLLLDTDTLLHMFIYEVMVYVFLFYNSMHKA